MALEQLNPNGDGTLNAWTSEGAAPHFDSMDDYATGAHDSDTTYVLAPNKTDASAFYLLSDTAAGFDPTGISEISLRITARRHIAGTAQGADSVVLYAQVFKADEVTALTNEVAINGGATLTNTYVEFINTFTQQGSPTKADWDGARLRLRQDYIQQGNADTTVQVRVTAARVEISWTPALPNIANATIADAGRNFNTSRTQVVITTSETVKRATAGGYAAGDVIPGLTIRRTQLGNTTTYLARYVSGDLNLGTSSFTVDIPVILRAGDSIEATYDQDIAGSELVAVDDGQEMLTSVRPATNNLTKRVRKVIRDSSLNPIVSTTVKYFIGEFDNAAPANANYMARTNKGTVTTDANGLVDIEYTGATEPLGTVYFGYILSHAAPTESRIGPIGVN